MHRNSIMKNQQFVAGVVVGILGTILLSRLMSNMHSSQSTSNNHQNQKSFDLFVNLEFNNEKEKERFKKIFAPMAEYVKKHEPTTLSYELIESDKNVHNICIVERYVDKAAYTDIHRTSKEFVEFRQLFSEFEVTIVGNSYYESNIGFIDR